MTFLALYMIPSKIMVLMTIPASLHSKISLLPSSSCRNCGLRTKEGANSSPVEPMSGWITRGTGFQTLPKISAKKWQDFWFGATNCGLFLFCWLYTDFFWKKPVQQIRVCGIFFSLKQQSSGLFFWTRRRWNFETAISLYAWNK